jgi:hypothetical protein
MSGNTGYTNPGYSGGSYLGAMQTEGGNTNGMSSARFNELINTALATENRYLDAIHTYEPLLSDYVINGADPEKQLGANAELKLMPALTTEIEANLTKIESILYRYQNNLAPIESLSLEYFQTVFHSNQEADSAINNWVYLTTD